VAFGKEIVMGPGHFGVAFAVKPIVPRAPLWMLLVAREVLDLLCFGFVALGMERTSIRQIDLARGVQTIVPGYLPWSHGLFMSLVWSVLAAGIAYLFIRDRRASGIVGAVVFSHWILDFIVHPPHLPIFFDAARALGLGRWTSGTGLILSGVLEVALLAGGIAISLIAGKRKTNRAAMDAAQNRR
jgi:hypothetical protein